MKAISLCSGMDGFSYAASLLGIEVTAHVEIDPVFDEHYKRHWPHAKRFYDLRTVTGEELGPAHIIYGGEPCQGNSIAGQRKGQSDDRYLWPDYWRICKSVRPNWIINENVVGSVSNMVLDTKIADMESEGYTCRAFNIPAAAVGAYHERQRIWLVAYSNGDGLFRGKDCLRKPKIKQPIETLHTQKNYETQFQYEPGRNNDGRIWPTPVGGLHQMVNDVPSELAEIKAYGNAVVPWIPYVILSFILQIENGTVFV